MEITVRSAVPADAEPIAEIWRLGWQDGHRGFVPEELVRARPPESFGERAAARIGDATVAMVDREVAGFVMVAGDEVEQVYVAAEHRGSGVSKALIAEAERHVAANGHDRAWLAVVAGNARARAFYERAGWHDEGMFDYQAAGPDGPIAVPCHRYAKLLKRARSR